MLHFTNLIPRIKPPNPNHNKSWPLIWPLRKLIAHRTLHSSRSALKQYIVLIEATRGPKPWAAAAKQKGAQLPSTRSSGIIPSASLGLGTNQLTNLVVTGYMCCGVFSATFHDTSTEPRWGFAAVLAFPLHLLCVYNEYLTSWFCKGG
jgi:hypothetical protein